MKKNCNPVIGNSTEFRIPFSVWRKRSCEEKLKSFESPTWAPIQEYFDHSLENGSADDRPCYQHAYNLIGKCLKRELTQQREAKRPQRKRKHISLEEDEKQRQSQSQPLVQNILVLGMMGIQPDQYDLAKVTRQSTYPPPLRDFNRLQALQRQFPDSKIYTLNMAPIEGIEVQPTHIFTNITRRGAIALHRTFPEVKFDLILLDYFRFPTAYMKTAYGSFCSKDGFLATLRKNNMLSDHVQVFVPHLRTAGPFCGARKRFPFQTESVEAGKNPLSQATQAMNRELLGGYTNEAELGLLQARYPFTRVFRSSRE